MELKQAFQKCARIAKNAPSDRLKFIKVKTTGKLLELTATDSFRIVKEAVKIDQVEKFEGFLNCNFKKIEMTSAQKKQVEAFEIGALKTLPELTQKIYNSNKKLEPKTIKDIKKNLVKNPDYPKLPIFKFEKYLEIETDPLKRFCRIHLDKNISLKITGGRLFITYKNDEIKTKIEAPIIKSNIGYFKTVINSKLLKDILPKEKIVKIKVGKSGREPLSFDNQIIMPLIVKA